MASADKDSVLAILKATAMFTTEELAVAEEIIDLYLGSSEQKDYDIAVIEDQEQRVAGYVVYGSTPMTEGTFDVYWMAVAPWEQNKGYGKRLVAWVEDKIRGLHGRMIVIETSSQPKYEPTRRFYIRAGYKEISRIPDFYRKGDDRIIYVKYLDR